MPPGLFLLEHFYTNSKALTGAADFNSAVKDLQSIPTSCLSRSAASSSVNLSRGLWMVITVEARPNNLHYPTRETGFTRSANDWRHPVFLYYLPRFEFSFWLIPGLNTIRSDNPDQAFKIVSANSSRVDIYRVRNRNYATVWHLANGIWLFLVDWASLSASGHRKSPVTRLAPTLKSVLLQLLPKNPRQQPPARMKATAA